MTVMATSPAETTTSPVLIVDDDEDIRDIIGHILNAHGYRVAKAANGAEALRIVRSGVRPFLILLDLRMPVMSGEEFKAELDRDSIARSHRIPVVILSGDGALTARTSAMGAADCVRKPIDLHALVSLVKRYDRSGLS